MTTKEIEKAIRAQKPLDGHSAQDILDILQQAGAAILDVEMVGIGDFTVTLDTEK